jgi:hypothetical protein
VGPRTDLRKKFYAGCNGSVSLGNLPPNGRYLAVTICSIGHKVATGALMFEIAFRYGKMLLKFMSQSFQCYARNISFRSNDPSRVFDISDRNVSGHLSLPEANYLWLFNDLNYSLQWNYNNRRKFLQMKTSRNGLTCTPSNSTELSHNCENTILQLSPAV